jgi:hypothetical protein
MYSLLWIGDIMVNRKLFDAVKNPPRRGEFVAKKKDIAPAPFPVDPVGPVINDEGQIPSWLNTAPNQAAQQHVGTSGLGDYGIGTMWDSNPDYFGSGQWQWNQLSDLTQQSQIYQQYLDHISSGGNAEYFQDLSMFEGLDWAQAEAAYNWDQSFGPSSGGAMGWMEQGSPPDWYDGPDLGGAIQPGLTDVTYNQDYLESLAGSQAPPWAFGTNQTAFGNMGVGSQFGGGIIGGSGDLGTGSAFAGGSMYNTQMGGGLWDYDCDTQGPSYNSAGECIACCN